MWKSSKVTALDLLYFRTFSFCSSFAFHSQHFFLLLPFCSSASARFSRSFCSADQESIEELILKTEASCLEGKESEVKPHNGQKCLNGCCWAVSKKREANQECEWLEKMTTTGPDCESRCMSWSCYKWSNINTTSPHSASLREGVHLDHFSFLRSHS